MLKRYSASVIFSEGRFLYFLCSVQFVAFTWKLQGPLPKPQIVFSTHASCGKKMTVKNKQGKRGFLTLSYFHIQTDILLKDTLSNKFLGQCRGTM